jgi:uncharacterized protein (DUF58 family)
MGTQTLPGLFASRAQRWARRRQGLDPVSVTLKPGRIYILPTRSGLILGLVLLTMLVGSLNYSNNMGFALTFFLASMAIVSLHLCHRNLAGLRISLADAQPVHAGQALHCVLALANDSGRSRYQLAVGPDDRSAERLDLPPGGCGTLTLRGMAHRRGLHPLPPIELSTRFPLGLFRAWAWLNLAREVAVYPQPAAADETTSDPAPANAELATTDGQDQAGEEFSGLRDYLPGEPPSRIAWKVLARTGELMARDFRGSATPLWLDWRQVAGSPGQRIGRLTRLVLEADARGEPYGLRLPDREVPPGSSAGHRHRCLLALALLPGDD